MGIQIQSNFKPYPAQRRVLKAILEGPEKYHVLVSSRQVGKSLMALNLLLKFALETPNNYCMLVSPIFSQSKKAFLELMKAAGPDNPLIQSANATDLMMVFKNGSIIRMVSAETEQNLRGITLSHLVLDECAYIKESLWTEVLSAATMIRGKKVLFISTPRAKNWFYHLFERGQDPEAKNWSSYRINSEENPYLNQEELEIAKKTLPPAVFLSEYMGIFTESSSGVFGEYEKCTKISQLSDPIPGEKYYAGLDLALANDFTVLTILDSKGNLVHMFRENKTSWEQIIGKVDALIRKWDCQTLVELNSIGSVVHEQLKRSLGTKIKSITTGSNKSDLIEALKLAFSDEKIAIPDERLMPELHLELSTFTYKILPSGKLSYGAPSGLHDDIVMSLAFAWKNFQEGQAPQYAVKGKARSSYEAW
jgi:hypothetical protein